MLDEEVVAVVLAVLIVTAVFAVSQAMTAGRVVEPFSELGLLGPGKMIGGYPRVVVAGKPFLLHVYIGNHEGRTVWYRILIKLGNESTFVNSTVSAEAPVILWFDRVIPNNGTWIEPVKLTIPKPGKRLRIIVEMWTYDGGRDVFVYHGRWNQLWVNATAPP